MPRHLHSLHERLGPQPGRFAEERYCFRTRKPAFPCGAPVFGSRGTHLSFPDRSLRSMCSPWIISSPVSLQLRASSSPASMSSGLAEASASVSFAEAEEHRKKRRWVVRDELL